MEAIQKKHKIVVLTNLKDDLTSMLKSAVKLAWTIDAEISVFNVQKPSEVVKKENQLSAVKSIYSTRISIDKKMQGLVDPIAQQYDIAIKYSSSIGNVKSEISNYLEQHQPDMLVLGKRKSIVLKFIGDGITDYILNTYNGDIVIIPRKNNLDPEEDISFGIVNAPMLFSNFKFSKQLLKQTKGPIKSFRFETKSQSPKEPTTYKDNKTIEYIFEHNENALEKLPNYVSKSNINLLLLKNKNIEKDPNMKQLNLGNLIKKLDVPIMVVGDKK